MSAENEPGRVGVYYRPRQGRWQLVVTAGSAELARKTMIGLLGTRPSGDWCVAPTSAPPGDRPRVLGDTRR